MCTSCVLDFDDGISIPICAPVSSFFFSCLSWQVSSQLTNSFPRAQVGRYLHVRVSVLSHA